MNILQMHQRATKKANIYYHRFLTKYKKNEKKIYVFAKVTKTSVIMHRLLVNHIQI